MIYRYYSTQRPVMPGGFPKRDTIKEIVNFDNKTFVDEIGREAWGYIDYTQPLTMPEAFIYELLEVTKNAT